MYVFLPECVAAGFHCQSAYFLFFDFNLCECCIFLWLTCFFMGLTCFLVLFKVGSALSRSSALIKLFFLGREIISCSPVVRVKLVAAVPLPVWHR